LSLQLERTQVGDRYVVEQMRAKGYNVGGEQSGHIILSDFSTTGDGLLAALQVLAVIVQSGKPASEVCKLFDPAPQILENVRYEKGKPDPMEAASVKAAIKEAEASLAGTGRLLVRKSGTEPLVRIMAEGDDEKLVKQAVAGVKSAVVAAAKAACNGLRGFAVHCSRGRARRCGCARWRNWSGLHLFWCCWPGSADWLIRRTRLSRPH
jgi:phosphoglucosamine mutase